MPYVDGFDSRRGTGHGLPRRRLAARDARARSQANADTAAGRMRRAVLPLVAGRLPTRPMRPRQGRDRCPDVDLPKELHEAVGLLDLTPTEFAAAEKVLQDEERRDGEMVAAVTELGDWLDRHDEIVRKLAAMNLALRQVHQGHRTGAGKRAFRRLEKALEDSDDVPDDGPVQQTCDSQRL